MKKLLVIVLLFGSVAAVAQPNNRTSAIMTYKDAAPQMQAGDTTKAILTLEKAAKYIDAAQKHEKTKNDPKTLKYMGDIYMQLSGLYALTGQMDKVEATGSKAMDGYKRCLAIKKKNTYLNEVKGKLGMMGNMALNQGVNLYNEKKYGEAVEMFKGAVEMAEILGVKDTLAIYNVGLASERGEDYATAYEYYRKCADMGYRGPLMYSFMINVLRQQDKNDEALAVVKEGREKYPTDKDLIINMVNFYLRDGNFEEAEKNLAQAIEQDSDNHVLHFSIGSVYDNLKKYDDAEKAYKKALELKPDYFDANYNLGALYFNKAVDMNNALSPEMKQAEYDAAKAKIDEVFKMAVPSLEKAQQLKPDDLNTLSSLMQVYARLNETDKYNAAKAEIERIKNGG